MAWIAATNIPGVTVAGVFQAFATSPPWPPTGTAASSPSDYTVAPDGKITVLHSLSLGGWMRFTLTDTLGTLAGVPEFPAIPCRLTADITGASSGVNHYDMASQMASVHNDQITTNPQTETSITYDGGDFDIAVGSDGSFASSDPQNITLLLEMDITLSVPEFWTDNVACVEDAGVLTKPAQFVFVPEVEGQPFIPASFNCYPPPPPPPPIVPPPPPGGGSGSGPPHGDCYDAPMFEYFILCHGYPPGDPLGSPPCLPTQVLVGFIRVCP